ncbi:hypothetical protein KR059_006327, partial [Drosophila kikkawai]
RPLLSTNCTDFVLAHSKGALRPVRQLPEVILLPHILEMMHKLRLNRLLRVQSHTWPHLIVDRGHGAMVVAAPRSGRTFSYLPPVCDVISRTIMATVDTDNLLGALAVILVKDLERVRHVSAVCHAFLRKLKHATTYTLVLNIPSDNNPEFFHCLFNGVGCLVATPAQLVWMFKDMEKLMKFEHLKFIVYDDIDLMDPRLLTKAELVLKNLILMDHSHPQMVMISQTYDPVQMARLKLLNSNPVLIFGDMLEAALYGKARLRIAICPQQKKFNEVLKILEQRPPQKYRTVIFCSDDADMRRLVVHLLEKKEPSFSCLPYYEDADMEVAEQVQGWLVDTQGIILLATDNCPELSIRHAHTLIHYSMSLSWGKFKMRHLAISGNLVNRLVSDSSTSEKGTFLQPHSLILLDESNQKQLPRLVDFVGKHQPVDEEIKALAKKIREKFAKLEANQNVVCRQIMMLGDCINKQCEERHHADHMDRPLATVPTLGDIKVSLVRVYSPTHLCVHLLEHLPPGESWKPYPSLPAQQMRLQLLQSNCSMERFWPPIAGTICLYRNKAINVRVRVLKVAPIEDVNIYLNNLYVLVQAMDEDTQIFSVRSGRLYKCPEELQAEPPLAIDLRLFGLIPQSGERGWSEKDRRDIEYKLKNLPIGCFLQATIQFATSHTIFVSNLVAMFYASAMKVHVRKLSLGQHLIKAKLAKSCPLAKDTIFTFFEEVLEVKEEGDDKQKLKAEEQLKEENNNETKENNPPNKTFIQGRALSVIQMGLDQVKRNMLARERKVKEASDEAAKVEQEEKDPKDEAKKLKKEEKESKQPEQIPKDPEDQSAESNKSLNQLIQCIENIKIIAKLEAEEDDNHMFADTLTGATKLIDIMKGYPEVTNDDKQKKKTEKKKATKDSISKFTVTKPRDPTMQLQLPSNVVRPPTNYYQTLTTLELQVLLPDEGYKYSALLIDNQVLFQATHPSLELCHEFQLPLGVAYSYLKDYMRGRTVYISVKKTVAMPDPLNFDLYQRFLKPNHEKFGKMDEQREEQEKKPRKAVPFKDVGWHNEYQEIEDSADEDHHVDGIERVEHDLYDE